MKAAMENALVSISTRKLEQNTHSNIDEKLCHYQIIDCNANHGKILIKTLICSICSFDDQTWQINKEMREKMAPYSEKRERKEHSRQFGGAATEWLNQPNDSMQQAWLGERSIFYLLAIKSLHAKFATNKFGRSFASVKP